MNNWKDIWEENPPRNEEILFMTGNSWIHYGEIYGTEGLRKCIFHSFSDGIDYDCDSSIPKDRRVIYWFPIPNIPIKETEDE